MAAILALSGGRRWGWGLVTFAPPNLARPGSFLPRPHRRYRSLPRELRPAVLPHAPATRPAGGARDSPTAAENPLPHHRMVAAITVTRRDVPPPPPEKPGGRGQTPVICAGAGCGDAVRRREQELRPGIEGGAMGGAGMSAARSRCAHACIAVGGSGKAWSGPPARAVVPPTFRLRLAARVAQSVAGERLRGDPTE